LGSRSELATVEVTEVDLVLLGHAVGLGERAGGVHDLHGPAATVQPGGRVIAGSRVAVDEDSLAAANGRDNEGGALVAERHRLPAVDLGDRTAEDDVAAMRTDALVEAALLELREQHATVTRRRALLHREYVRLPALALRGDLVRAAGDGQFRMPLDEVDVPRQDAGRLRRGL